MHIRAGSDSPVSLTCAGLNTGVIMTPRADVERERSTTAKCFPSATQDLMCRPAYRVVLNSSGEILSRGTYSRNKSTKYGHSRELSMVLKEAERDLTTVVPNALN